MDFKPGNVVALLVQQYGVGNADSPTRKETKLLAAIRNMFIICADSEDFEFETDEDIDTNPDWEPEEKIARDENFPNNSAIERATPNLVKFSGNRLIPLARVREALAYYRKPKKETRPLSSMTTQFAFINNDHDLTKLRDFERNG